MLHQKSATGLISRLLIRMACSYLHLCSGSNVKGEMMLKPTAEAFTLIVSYKHDKTVVFLTLKERMGVM